MNNSNPFVKKTALSRREFLRGSAFAGAGLWLGAVNAWGRHQSPNDKLNIGIIGTANRAASNIAGVESQNIVAVCDIDDKYLTAIREKHPGAKGYNDFRKLLEQKDIDAVVVSTTDHTHAFATMGALKSGRHVYCEKPLAHDVSEARAVALAATKYKRATQMGTQIHAGNNYRRVVELVQSGAIGPVTECHIWCSANWSGGDRPKEVVPVPSNLHWDLWLGPAPERPYNPTYLPANWRRWWDFGNGTIGDMACHYMDLAFWALKLRHPLTVEAEGPPVNPETTPPWLIVRYQHGARGELPPVQLTWYDAGKKPELVTSGKVPSWGSAVLFIGAKGMLLADYERHMLLPEAQFTGFVPPAPFIPDSVGHYEEWINACKTGSATSCNFDYSGALTEAVLLGNAAYRTGTKLEWDGPALKVKNNRDAMKYIHRAYRSGWSL